MFTHLYQRQHFKEAEVRVYGGEIVLALEHLHKVREDLAMCLLPWALGLGPRRGLQIWQPQVSLSSWRRVGDRGCFPSPLGKKASALPGGVSSPHVPSKVLSSHRELRTASWGHVYRTSSNRDLMPCLPKPS